jgi:hypothetical protein
MAYDIHMSSSSQSILDHIADFLKFISNTQSFWFTLDTSYNHGCHLANRFGLEPNDYEVLLIVAGLAHHTRFGFAMKPTAWSKFLRGHRFASDDCEIELTSKMVDLDAYIDGTPPSRLKRRKFYVVRIGNKTERSPNKIEEQMGQDGRCITTPPRLNGIGIKTQSFRRIVEPFIWDYLVENDMDSKDSIGVPENKNEEDKDTIGVLAGPQLTPPGATPVISPMNKKRKLNEVMSIGSVLNEETSTGSVPSNDIDYPLLSRALGREDGFNPSDPTIQKYMRALLAELIDLLSTNYELNAIDSSNNRSSFVRVPKTSNDRSFQNSKEWLDVAIKIAASKHKTTYEAAYRIANHLCRFYKDSVLAACETQKIVVCEPMSATAFSAMMCAGKISGTGELEVKKHLSAHLGPGFCPTRTIFDRFSAIFKGGKRPNCALSDANIDALCLQFREVFVLWDGVFSLARTINPTEGDTSIYRMYVDAAVKGSKDLQCTVTPKVHLMLEHVEWQMTNIEGGLGDKMEDWVERLHQTGKRQRLRYRTVQNPVVRSLAREKANSRNMHPDVIAQTDKIKEGSKRNLTEQKTDLVGMLRKRQRDFGRFEAMKYFKQDDKKRLTWSAAVFNDAKEGASNADAPEHLCHLEKELSSTKL